MVKFRRETYQYIQHPPIGSRNLQNKKRNGLVNRSLVKKNQKFRSYNFETYRCPTPEETYKKKTRNALENVSLKKINKKIK